MWLYEVFVIASFCCVWPTSSEATPRTGQCVDSSREGACASDQTDLAGKIIDDLYLAIKEAEQNLANPKDYPPDYRPKNGEEFDFIVVGAGSAGAVLANRLTEVPSWRVLLIEAGGNPTKSSEIPGLTVSMQLTDIDWQYKSDPEENNCLGMVNNSCNFPRGKILGGSSILNYMNYVRGNEKDFDSWAAAGNSGWSFEDVLPYFRKAEDMQSPEIWETENAEKYHGKGGYLKTRLFSHSDTDPLLDICWKGIEELGYQFNHDYNGKSQTGTSRFQATIDGYKRCSTARGYLSPVKDRENLKVAKYSFVTKVLIDEKTSTAFGVEFEDREGNTIKVRSKKEVLMSAGAISTPQILMLSGVGPKQHLKQLGLPIIQDLPVGQNLQDHPLTNSLVISVNVSVPPLSPMKSMVEFLTEGSGGLTNLRATTHTAFINTIEGVDYPDIQFIPIHFCKNDPKSVAGFLTVFGVRAEIIEEFIESNKHGDSILLLASLMRPYSRGSITLKNIDPKNHPRIVSGMFLDQRDVETCIRTTEFIEKLVETEAMKSVDAKLHEVRLTGCEKYNFRSREYRECSLRHLTATTYHYCGTCKMGPPSDPGAVVDPSLRVYGVKGLRVADASVFPTIISGNINAPVIMVAEKAADLIKTDWKKRDEF